MSGETSSQEWMVRLTVPAGDVAAVEAVLEAHEVAGQAPSIAAFAHVDNPQIYRVEAYFTASPDGRVLQSALAMALGSAVAIDVAAMAPTDWVSVSQSMQPPIHAGRFCVHGSHARDAVKPGQIGLEVEAAQAFGTGGHETTLGCLHMLDRLAKSCAPKAILDLGTGTGILAMAAARIFNGRVVASDIDPLAIAVARENAQKNNIPIRQSAYTRSLWLMCANGMGDRRIRRAAPYDLVIANILARPLCAMAPQIAAAVGTGGYVVLSGLLSHQQAMVVARYRTLGLSLAGRQQIGDWPTLLLRRRHQG